LDPSVVHSNKYCTGGVLASVAVVAVIVIVYAPVAVGTTDHVIGFGVGAVVSGGQVVAERVAEKAVSLWLELLSRALT
jgi:hypothetical protein